MLPNEQCTNYLPFDLDDVSDIFYNKQNIIQLDWGEPIVAITFWASWDTEEETSVMLEDHLNVDTAMEVILHNSDVFDNLGAEGDG